MKNMKNVILVCLLLAVSSIAMSQEIRFAAKGGLNVGSLKISDGSGSEESGSKVSMYLGGRVEYGLSQNMSIQGELLYQSFGGELSYGTETAEFSINEISLPIVFKYYVIEKLSFNGGISLAYVLGGKYEYSGDFGNESGDMEGLSSINFGISLGGEFLLTDNIFIDMRYNLGLSNLSSEGDGTVNGNVLQIGGGYRF